MTSIATRGSGRDRRNRTSHRPGATTDRRRLEGRPIGIPFDVSRLPRQARIVARALKEYGMLVADNGSDWYISGAPNRGWDNDALRRLGDIRGADFEVVETG